MAGQNYCAGDFSDNSFLNSNNPNTIEYDNIVSAFHSTIARQKDGSVVIWGEATGPQGTDSDNIETPLVISPANGYNYNGNILKFTIGSWNMYGTNSYGENYGPQFVILTTDGLYAWGQNNIVFPTSIKGSNEFEKLVNIGNSNEYGLPIGVNPENVKMMFAAPKVFVIVTCTGEVYVVGKSYFQAGGCGSNCETSWVQVKKNNNEYLTNIVAVRGTAQALFALSSTLSNSKLYTWGKNVYLSNGNSFQNLAYPTEMQPLPNGKIPKMIDMSYGSTIVDGVFEWDYVNTYHVLSTDGKIYSVGSNTQKQIGDGSNQFSIKERTEWTQPVSLVSDETIAWISASGRDGEMGYGASINALSQDKKVYAWGSNATGMINGNFPPMTIDPQGEGIDPVEQPGGLDSNDKILAVATGGHTTIVVKECSQKFGYVGHYIHGSMGGSANSSYSGTKYTFEYTGKVDFEGVDLKIPFLGIDTLYATCGSSVNLNDAIVSSVPAGYTIKWFSDSLLTIEVSDPTFITQNGMFYPVYYDIFNSILLCNGNVVGVKIDVCPIKVGGTIFHDINKNTIIDDLEEGTTAGTDLYVYLVNENNTIVDSSKVNVDGTYELTGIPNEDYSTTFTIHLSQELYSINTDISISPIDYTLPAKWVHTGENGNNNTGIGDGSPDGILAVTIGNTNISNQNFGLHYNSTNAVNDENSTWMNTPVSGDVATNDFDLEGDTQAFGSFLNQDGSGTPITSGSTVSGIDASGNPVADAGTITFNIDGTYTFIPSNGFVGNVEIPYNTCDNGLPTACDTAVLNITVSPFTSKGNSVIANNDEYYSYGNPIYADVFVNDADPQGDNFTVTEVKQGIVIINIGTPTQVSGWDEKGNPVTNAGTLTQNADGSMTFVPEAGFAGTVTYNYTITDDNGTPASDNADVVITVLRDQNGPKNDPPFAGDDFATTKVNTPVTGNFIGNDDDPNNDSLSYNGVTIDPNGLKTPINTVTTEKGGTVVLYTDGTYEYTPPTDYIGPDAVVYEVCDVTIIEPQPLCANATIHLLVGGYGIAGHLFNDVNGMKDGLVNGNGTNVSDQMYAILTNELGEVIKSVAIAADGSYSFDNLLNNVHYSVWIDTNDIAAGLIMTNSNVPNGWVSTGENIGATPGNDGNTNGILQVGLLTNDVKDVNFAIEELPETVVNKINDNNYYQPGDGINIPADAFTEAYQPSIDPSTEDYSGGTVDSIRFTTFPYEDDGIQLILIESIEINGQNYTPSTWPSEGVVVAYDPNTGISGVKVYPKNGQHEIVIPIASIDNAGFEDPTPGKITLNLENALPIHILNFTAKGDNCNVELNWNVRFDENGSVLNVEESKDGRHFKAISSESLNVKNANSSMKHTATEGLNYYRLNIVTASGQNIYSAVKSVTTNCKEAMISLYPNPVQNELSVIGLVEGQTIHVYNSLGQVVKNVKATSGILKLNTQTLAKGSYYITVQDNNNTVIQSLKFVKQ